MVAADADISAIGSIHQVTAAEWDSLAGDHPFGRHAFLSALEDSGAVAAAKGWLPQHIVVRDGARLVAALPCYLKGHSYGEYVFDQSWADAFERSGGRYYPKLQAAIPFTPVTGPRLLRAPGVDAEAAAAWLIGGALSLVGQKQLSSFHLTFLEEDEALLAERAGLLIRTDQQFHWHNPGYRDFDDFLAALASRKRKQISRERRAAKESGLTITRKPGPELDEADWDAFYSFYLDTAGRKWGRPYLNRQFFSLIGERMADRILLVEVRDGDRPIAGALNFLSESRIYGRWWGALEHHPFLHFEACYYQAMEHAIAHGLDWVEAGAQGPHKLLRGYQPVITRSAHHIEDPRFRDAVARYLEMERVDVDEARTALMAHLPFRKGQDSLRPMPE